MAGLTIPNKGITIPIVGTIKKTSLANALVYQNPAPGSGAVVWQYQRTHRTWFYSKPDQTIQLGWKTYE